MINKLDPFIFSTNGVTPHIIEIDIPEGYQAISNDVTIVVKNENVGDVYKLNSSLVFACYNEVVSKSIPIFENGSFTFSYIEVLKIKLDCVGVEGQILNWNINIAQALINI